MTPRELWERYKAWSFEDAGLGLRVDLSRMGIEEAALAEREPLLQAAYEQMAALEKGAIANPDERRMVGHYWLRAPELAPTAGITAAIRGMQERCWTSPPACTMARSLPRGPRRSASCWSSGSAARRSGPSWWPMRWEAPAIA